MLAKLARAIPEGDGWLFEPKWDGFRCIVFRDGDRIELISRKLRPLDRYFPELLDPLARGLPERCVVDGEIVVADVDGRGLDFDALLQRIHPAESRVDRLAAETPAAFVAFDLLADGDRPARRADVGRRRRSSSLGSATTSCTHAGEHVARVAERVVRTLRGRRPRRVVAKPLDGAYQPGKRALVKVKHERTADCAVAGYRIHKDGRASARCCSACSTTPARCTRSAWRRRSASSAGRAARRTRAAHPRRARRPPVAGVGRVAGRARDVVDAVGGQPLERGQGPLVRADPDGPGRRGDVRPARGRPLPPRREVPALAAGSHPGELPLRPARRRRAVSFDEFIAAAADRSRRSAVVGGIVDRVDRRDRDRRRRRRPVGVADRRTAPARC